MGKLIADLSSPTPDEFALFRFYRPAAGIILKIALTGATRAGRILGIGPRFGRTGPKVGGEDPTVSEIGGSVWLFTAKNTAFVLGLWSRSRSAATPRRSPNVRTAEPIPPGRRGFMPHLGRCLPAPEGNRLCPCKKKRATARNGPGLSLWHARAAISGPVCHTAADGADLSVVSTHDAAQLVAPLSRDLFLPPRSRAEPYQPCRGNRPISSMPFDKFHNILELPR